MHNDILAHLDNPQYLEQLYRADKPAFRKAFDSLYPQIENNLLAKAWHERLSYNPDGLSWGTPRDRVVVLLASVVAALLAKLPAILSLAPGYYYPRNIGFIAFPLLIGYFAWKQTVPRQTGIVLAVLMGLAAVYINWLPQAPTSDTLILACLHLPLWLWSLLGFTFTGGRLRRDANWLGFLRYNGELVVMTAVLLLACGLATAITINLFNLIGWNIIGFYSNYVVICSLAALPIVATYLTQVQPALVGKVSPVIARLFSPFALVMLLIYLVAMTASGKNLYHDRAFLLLFNGLLVGVMALIFFSVAGTGSVHQNRVQLLILFLLSIVTILINGIALSAILFRIAEWGITPNRAAVLGSNVLILCHLLLVGFRLWQVTTRRSDLSPISRSMAYFLPVYSAWAVVVVFVFPLLFGFK
ncbi:hypothetical protein CLV58_1015 [Spirosoma oryzae]|uniref:DUF4153 domain-containing protein n=1 Tax=Spirosoma oryzae TaxID=1469603 RepID=A0A2T0TMW2_9BACT|nr:hypothetical protein [Spirosoma oryzae]PRY46941.1 hypothetical protein CLV58_1015 [Spirosoma oryzae]